MKEPVRSNKVPFHLQLIGGLVVSLFIITRPGLTYANGGTTLLVQKVGAYELIVTASPFPLEVGVNNDISVLVGRLSDKQVELNAQVILTAESLDQPSDPQTFFATHANATNKLYYAANVVFPTPGRWKLTVQVDGPEGSASTVFETEAEQQSSLGFLRYLSLAGLSLVVIALLFFMLSRQGKQELNSYFEGEDQ